MNHHQILKKIYIIKLEQKKSSIKGSFSFENLTLKLVLYTFILNEYENISINKYFGLIKIISMIFTLLVNFFWQKKKQVKKFYIY